uniref:T-box domain-containing protein n=1 Tax=Parascaris univalens TaxID=6257 RepID=A0A915BJ34_PARUN
MALPVDNASGVRVKIANEELWRQFHKHTTEMIVTKSGRKLFPKVEYQLEGLQADANYALVLHIERVDDIRYKFTNGEWVAAGRADPRTPSRPIHHQDGISQSGKAWMRGVVCFDRVKLTNSAQDIGPNVQLYSMHKYRPVLHVYRINDALPYSPTSMYQQMQNQLIPVAIVSNPIMDFIAVTAYQNQNVIKLKIEHNPFAKGFREGAERKRSLSISPNNSSSPSPSSKRLSRGSTHSDIGTFSKYEPSVLMRSPPTAITPMGHYTLPAPNWSYSMWNPSAYMFAPMINPLNPYQFPMQPP